jgi:tetratricopeptide (TPR) repeat protein
MDGRWKLALAGLFAGLVGCTTTTVPPNPFPAALPPPSSPGKNTVFVAEPADDGEKKTGPVSSGTKVLYANMCVEAVAKDPNRPAPDRERTLGQARQIYQEVLAAEPKNLDALTGLGDMYQVTGEKDRLAEVVGRVTKAHPADARAWAWAAVKHAQAKNWPAAIDAYGRAATLDPDNRTYRIHLGLTLARAGRYDEGYEWLAKLMREADARYNLAMMMLHNGDAERARAELDRCLKVDPNFAPAAAQLSALAAENAPRPVAPVTLPVAPAGPAAGGVEELAPVQLGPAR